MPQLAFVWNLALGAFSTAVLTQPTWHPPNNTATNNLTQVLYGSGTNGFIYNTSVSELYGVYNYCNMPHVRRQEYVVPTIPAEKGGGKAVLEYVEILQRHHKRTPYYTNLFPRDGEDEGGMNGWNCNDVRWFSFAEVSGADNKQGQGSAKVYTQFYDDPLSPLRNPISLSDCKFPQITAGGLVDAWQHGRDLYSVYHHQLGFIPMKFDGAKIRFRVTSNEITTEVAGALIEGMYGDMANETPLYQQQASIDSLEPGYSCSVADSIRYGYITSPAENPTWKNHLDLSKGLFDKLDKISTVPPNDDSWHSWFDHYFDNLSSSLCHGKQLPCNKETGQCISVSDAEKVFKLGQWEYDYIFRSAGKESLEYSRDKYGLFIHELAESISAIVNGTGDGIIYRHNVAHDSGIAPLLGALQIGEMVWPGLGAEVVFEVWSSGGGGKEKTYFARILWGGKVMYSNALGWVDIIEADKLVEYMRGLVGPGGGNDVVERCKP